MRTASHQITPSVTALVEWGGAALPPRSVLAFDGVVIDPADRPMEVQRRPAVIGIEPAAIEDAFCVTTGPVMTDGLVEAVVQGLAVVDVDVTDAAHTHATATPGETAYLTSAASGRAEILWKPSGTGVKTCIVLLGSGSGAIAENVPPFAVLIGGGTPSSWTGREVNIASGTWSNSSHSGTTNARPVQIDGATFTPKSGANVLLFADEDGDLGYLPVQDANKVSTTYYSGYMSTGEQYFAGIKHFEGTYGRLTIYPDGISGATNRLVVAFSTVGGSSSYLYRENDNGINYLNSSDSLLSANGYATIENSVGVVRGIGNGATPATRTVKDGSGNNKNVKIIGGIIVEWEL